MQAKKVKNKADLEKVFDIRKKVFIKEQGVDVDDEFDKYDTLASNSEHILVYYQNKAVGTGRLKIIDDTAKLERICVLKEYREYGLGKSIVKKLEEIAKNKGAKKAKLHGQTQARKFYEKSGYNKSSEEFMEDGIPHYLMIKKL